MNGTLRSPWRRGRATVAPSPDEREEKDLLQLRDGGSKMREPYPLGADERPIGGSFFVWTLKNKVRAQVRAWLELP